MLLFLDGGIGKVYLKYPPKTKTLPPKGSGDWQMSSIKAWIVSSTGLEIIHTSSRIKTSMDQR